MKIFTKIYEWTLRWAEHKFAPRMLAALTFAESIFFPIPPDVLLAPMVLAKPEKAWSYALTYLIYFIVTLIFPENAIGPPHVISQYFEMVLHWVVFLCIFWDILHN